MAKEKTETDIADAPPAPTPAERVESWKDIAAYLQRDVRTVQRWEKNEGLPVYRHMHDKLGTVYAYKAELDAWWNNRRPRLEQAEIKLEEVGPASRRWRFWLGLSTATVVAITLAAVYWLWHRPALPFAERDWVLITAFENRTGEEVFDGALEYALERELSNSQYVNVVSRPRIADALQLMKLPPTTRLDAALGREVCLRDGGIRALLTGQVDKLDSTYVLSANLVDAERGVTVAGFSEEAAGQKEVLAALHRLSADVREALGEKAASIQQSQQKLARATTPSLRALRFFSEGMKLVDPPSEQNQWGLAANFFEQALVADPDFASAHIWLAHAYDNLKKTEEAGAHYARAFELAHTTTDYERYFILGSYYWRYSRDYEKAAQAFEVLVRLYPDHLWGAVKLPIILVYSGRYTEALPYFVREAELLPTNYDSNLNAALTLLVADKDLDKAVAFAERAQRLLTPELEAANPPGAVMARLFSANLYWRQGRIDKVVEELDRFALLADTRHGEVQAWFKHFLARAYLDLGQFDRAEALAPQSARPEHVLAVLAYLRGDNPALREQAKRLALHSRDIPTAVFLARAGLPAHSRALSALPEKAAVTTGYLRLVQGETELARGRPDKAVPLLQEALRQLPPWGGAQSIFLGWGALGEAWERRGEVPNAIQTLHTARRLKHLVLFPGSAWAWMLTQVQLAELERKSGNEQGAQEIENELRKLLSYADPDHPFLQKLQRSRELATAQKPK